MAEQSRTVRMSVVLALAHMPVDEVPLCFYAQWSCLKNSEDATPADYENLGNMTIAMLRSNIDFH